MKETDFCPICRYYLYLEEVNEAKDDSDDSETTGMKLKRICRNCGHHEYGKGGLILEINLKEKSSEGHKILINEFTTNDPTLPHVDTITCPNIDCDTNKKGVRKDVIYLKYDAINLKFMYICNVCNEKWKSKV
jgi:hypothetical protein